MIFRRRRQRFFRVFCEQIRQKPETGGWQRKKKRIMRPDSQEGAGVTDLERGMERRSGTAAIAKLRMTRRIAADSPRDESVRLPDTAATTVRSQKQKSETSHSMKAWTTRSSSLRGKLKGGSRIRARILPGAPQNGKPSAVPFGFAQDRLRPQLQSAISICEVAANGVRASKLHSPGSMRQARCYRG